MDYINKVFCRNCLDLMREMIDNNFKVDVIITDPPYGVNLDYDNYKDSFDNWKTLISKFIPLSLEVSKGLVIFPTSKFEGEKYIYKYFGDELLWRICWYKGATDVRCPIGWKDWELLFVFGKSKVQTHDFFNVAPLRHSMDSLLLKHPAPKSLKFSEWLVSHLSKLRDVIFDPFSGSGTILASSKKLGRNYVGCDISENYVSISLELLRQTDVKMNLERKVSKQVRIF